MRFPAVYPYPVRADHPAEPNGKPIIRLLDDIDPEQYINWLITLSDDEAARKARRYERQMGIKL